MRSGGSGVLRWSRVHGHRPRLRQHGLRDLRHAGQPLLRERHLHDWHLQQRLLPLNRREKR
jgi:hypothetical protein